MDKNEGLCTKKDLLEKLENSITGSIAETQKIHKEYFQRIRDLLCFASDDTVLHMHSVKELQKCFNQMKFDGFEAILSALVYEIETLSIQKQKELVATKKSKKRFKSFLVFAITTCLVAAVGTVLDWLKILDFGYEISSIIGLVDLLCGISFFTYEIISDRKSKDEEEEEINKSAEKAEKHIYKERSKIHQTFDSKVTQEIGNGNNTIGIEGNSEPVEMALVFRADVTQKTDTGNNVIGVAGVPAGGQKVTVDICGDVKQETNNGINAVGSTIGQDAPKADVKVAGSVSQKAEGQGSILLYDSHIGKLQTSPKRRKKKTD